MPLLYPLNARTIVSVSSSGLTFEQGFVAADSQWSQPAAPPPRTRTSVSTVSVSFHSIGKGHFIFAGHICFSFFLPTVFYLASGIL